MQTVNSMEMNEIVTRVEEADTIVREQIAPGAAEGGRYALPEGTILDERYRILRVIGQGGFGITYEALHIHNGNHVAVKEYFCRDFCGRETTCTGTNGCNVRILDSTQAAQFRSDLERFLKEARILHDFAGEAAIVTVLDYFEANDTAYIVMEYLDGTTLRDKIPAEGRWGMEKIVRSFGPVMEALEHVHSAGVIHRDISPDNLMCMPDGTLRLLDFGAARKFDNAQTTHSVIYKAYYSAPEQRDEKGVLGSWTDVYGLCSTMYYCLTGKEPEDVLTRLLYDDMERPSDKGADILPQAERTLMKGLELDRGARVQDMGKLRSELEKVYPPVSEEEKKRGRARRKRRRRVIAAAAAALVLCAAICAFVFRTRIRFQFIDTSTTVLNGEDMTPEEFAGSSAGARRRVAALAGDGGYLWEEHGQQIAFTVPAEVYGGQDPDTVVWSAISRRMIVRLNVRDRKNVNEQGETVLEYRFADVLHQEEDIERLEETEEGLVLTFTDPAKKKLASVLKTAGTEAVLIWDEYDEVTEKVESRYTYDSCVTVGDGESLLLKPLEETEISFPFSLLQELLTADPLPAAFREQSVWSTRWEDPGSTLLPGKYQCKANEVPGPTISVRYSSTSSKDFEDETGYRASLLSFQAILKNRLDSLEVPYAVGVNFNDRNEFVVRVPIESVYGEELKHLGESLWIKLGSDRTYSSDGIYGSVLKVCREQNQDTFELALVTEDGYHSDSVFKILQTLQDQGKKEVYLYFDDKAVAAADLQSAQKTMEENREIRFTRWLLPRHPEMTRDTEHFARYIAACIVEGPQDGFYKRETEICDDRGKVEFFSEEVPEEVFQSRAQELAAKWEKESPEQGTSGWGFRADEDSLSLDYRDCPIEDPGAALAPFMELYEKEDLGSGGIRYLYVRLYDSGQGEEYSVEIDLSLWADFEKDAMMISDYCNMYYNSRKGNPPAGLEDLYNDYLGKTPFWKEKTASDRKEPVFTPRE